MEETPNFDVLTCSQGSDLGQEQLNEIEQKAQAKSTKKATEWGLKKFDKWCGACEHHWRPSGARVQMMLARTAPQINNMPSKSLVIVLLLQNKNPFHVPLILDLWVSYSIMTPVTFFNRILISTSSFTIFGKCKKTTVKAYSGSHQFLESLR